MANTATIAKKANTTLVINAVRSSGALTIEEIAARTQMSRPTAVSIVRQLEAEHVLKRAGHASSEVGRQPVLYSIDDSTHFAIGIDIDGPPARIVLVDLAGNVHQSTEWSFSDHDELSSIVEVLVEQVQFACSAAGVAAERVLGIGLGLPASIDVDHNLAVNLSRLEALRGAPIADLLHQATGIPVLVRNDAHMIALAEAHSPHEDFLYIIFRTGVGMAVVIGSEVFEGESGNAGFIGHTVIDPHGPLCACGARGCLEAIVSKPAIVASYEALAGTHLEYQSILENAVHGDQRALEVLDTAGRWLGMAIANLVKTFDIYSVVLGDLGCDETHPFFTSIATTADAGTGTFLHKKPVFRAAQLNGARFALGGAMAIIERFFATPQLRLRTDA